MIGMSPYLLALLAAVAFALGSVLQQRGSLETKASEGDPHFLLEILKKPVWLLGGALQVMGWILQAAALVDGSLIVVQSICALSLVIALPLGVRFSGQRIGKRSVAGALITLIGIIAFLYFGQPQGGTSTPSSSSWSTCLIFSAGLMVTLTLFARKKRGPLAAVLFATAAGISYGFQAAVTKVFVTQLGNGVPFLLTSWTTYALILSALIGFGFQQSALKTGFLAPALAASNASVLVSSVIFGVALYQETLSNGQERFSPAIIALAIAIIGVVMLASPESAPQVKMEPKTPS
jgi:drug/metabolite transporter (DMT)-like permease